MILWKWVFFTNSTGQMLKIKLDQDSNLNILKEKNSLKNYYINIERTFTFSRIIDNITTDYTDLLSDYKRIGGLELAMYDSSDGKTTTEQKLKSKKFSTK